MLASVPLVFLNLELHLASFRWATTSTEIVCYWDQTDKQRIVFKFFLSVEFNYLLIFSPAHSSVAAVVNYRKVNFGRVNHNQLDLTISLLLNTQRRIF